MAINFILIFVLENKLVQWLKFTISGLGELVGISLTFVYNIYRYILLTLWGISFPVPKQFIFNHCSSRNIQKKATFLRFRCLGTAVFQIESPLLPFSRHLLFFFVNMNVFTFSYCNAAFLLYFRVY